MIKETRLTLRNWISAFESGEFDSNETQTQIRAGWWDWFCKDSSLRNKTYALAPKIKRIAKSIKINPESCYIFFKNNCPVCGTLYDDFRICDIEAEKVIWTIIPSNGHYGPYKGRSEVWGSENGFDVALVEGTWKDVLKFFEV